MCRFFFFAEHPADSAAVKRTNAVRLVRWRAEPMDATATTTVEPSGELWMHFTSCVTHRQLTRGQLRGWTKSD